MYKKKKIQSSGIKNELFKVQGRKTNFMQSLGNKTILLPTFYILHIKTNYNEQNKIRKYKQNYNSFIK